MNRKSANQIQNTKNADYTNLLLRKQIVWWKRLIDVQAPYRWNLHRLNPGFTLEIGCGIGRNLISLKGQAVGIDHNKQSVKFARDKGLSAFTPDEFQTSEFNKSRCFDTLLLAHVAEHMTKNEVIDLLTKYIPNLKADGRLITICPQEAGYRNDPTHIEFMDFRKIRSINEQLNLKVLQEYSFPFPRFIGNLFLYNEFVSISQKVGNH